MNDIRRHLIAELHKKREIVLPAGDHPLERELATMLEDGYVTETRTQKFRILAITELGDAAHEEIEQGAVADEAERQKRIAEETAVRRASDEAFRKRAEARRPLKARVIP